MNVRSRILIASAAVVTAGGLVTGAFFALEPTPVQTQGTAPGQTATPTRTATPAPSATPTPTPSAPPAEAAPPAAPAPPPAPPPMAGADPAESEVLALTNAERAAAGCAPLAADEGLASVARSHSADMAARDYFSHTTPEGLGPFDRAAAAGVSARAENIAAGQPDAAGVVAAWMGSEGHRANILNCGLTRLGVGVGHGGSYGITWTQLFG